MFGAGVAAVPASAQSSTLGIEGSNQQQYEMMCQYPNHLYTVAPPSNIFDRNSQNTVEKLLGGRTDTICLTVDQLERIRERIQVAEKREQQKFFRAISTVWMSHLARAFRKEQGLNHALIEKMFYPDFAPKYFDAVAALNLPRKFMWRPQSFSILENISRFALDGVDQETGKMKLSFEDWYHLHWNFYMPFNPVHYLCTVNSESCVWTEEFVNSLATYCKDRLEQVYDKKDGSGGGNNIGAPILMLGNRTGKLVGLLNQTKILPVEVIGVHENPNLNPYLLKIPSHKQKEFTPRPMQTMKDTEALDKYKPTLVLLSNMKANVDITSTVRRFGCVKEYMTIGVPDSYTEGHGWDTFGCMYFKEREDNTTYPAFYSDNFDRVPLYNMSRWLIHKYDSQEVFGLASCQTFVRRQYSPNSRARLHMNWLSRLRPPRF